MAPPSDKHGAGLSDDITITDDDWPAWRALRSDVRGLRTQPVVLGRYRLERELGQGTTGSVFRALDLDRNLPVAIKLLRRVTSQRLVSFKHEFRIAASVSHPNLVTPFELAALEHGWLIAMELVEGGDFATHVCLEPHLRVVDAPRFDEARLRRASCELLDGLEALHHAGYLHRDIKPSNVLVDLQGRVRVADLGLAILKEAAHSQDEEGRVVVGSPAYMAPEQVEGLPLSPAADLYAFGTLLFEAMTGKLPFDGPVHAVMLNKTLREPPPVEDFGVVLPSDLAELTRALLSRESSRRPSLSEARAMLRGGSRHMGLPSRRPRAGLIVGRQPELAALDQAVAARAPGHATLIHLVGSSGSGKSALLRAFCAQLAEQGRTWVLSGRCHELESIPRKGFDEVIDVLHERLMALPEALRRELVPANVVHAVPLFSTLADLLPSRSDEPNPEGATAAERTLLAHDAVCDLLSTVGRHMPLVLVIDDAQWSDQAGARLLRDLLAGPRRVGLVVVLAYRPEEAASAPMLQVLAEVKPASFVQHRVTVKPLDREDSVTLASRLLSTDDPTLAQRIADQARGEPFLIEQMALHGEVRASEGAELDQVIGERSAALNESSRILLEAIAVAGQPIPERLAALVVGQADVRASLSHLTTASLLRRTGSGPDALVYPYHDRVRVALNQRVAASRKVEIHSALAHHGERLGLLPASALAGHLARAGQRDRAAAQALAAAEVAENALAFDAAVDSYALALELGEGQAELLRAAAIGHARALFHAGRCAEAGDAYALAALQADDAEALQLLAVEAWLVSGRIAQARAQLEPVLDAWGVSYPSTTGAILRGLLRGAALTRMRARRPPLLKSQVDEVHARRSDVLWAAGKGLIAVSPGHGAVLAYDALLAAFRSRDARRIARGLAVVGSGVVPFVESVSEMYLHWARDVAHQLDDDHLRLMVMVGETCRATTSGNWTAAIDVARRALALAPRVKAPTAWEESVVHTLLGSAYEYQGDLARMERASEECLREFRARGDAITEVIVVSALGYTRAAAHDADALDAAIATMARLIPGWGLGYGQWDFYQARLEVLRALCWGDVDHAHAVLERAWPEIERAHLLQMPFVCGPALSLRSAVIHERLATDRQSRHLRRAALTNARALRKVSRADGPVAALISAAATAHAEGDKATRNAMLSRAIDGAQRADLGLVVRMCAFVQAGFEQDEVRQADLAAELRARGVADVGAWARFVTPGLVETPP